MEEGRLHTPHDVATCEREDQGASPDSADILVGNL